MYLIERSKYFGPNAQSFQLALAFLGSRILGAGESAKESWSKFNLVKHKPYVL